VPVLAAAYSHAAWAAAAVRRGWGAVLFAAADGLDDTASFPDGSWSLLARRAWAASRVLDAVERQPELDATRVVIGGHSRNGKAAIIAAAFDDRFAGVVSSSSGVLGAMPVRLCADHHFGEGVELLTRHFPDWFHPRLRFFAGREERLPTDAHELLALVAPRPVLLGVAANDQVESVPAAWEVKRTLDDLHRFLGGKTSSTTLLLREGGHPAGPAAVAQYLDWCEATFDGTASGPFIPPEEVPRGAAAAVSVPGRDEEPPGTTIVRTTTRTGLAVDLFLPAGLPADERPPVVLWCPPPCAPTGYVAGYDHATPIHALLARAGCAVVCWDPPGTGTRVHEPARPAENEAPAVLDAALAVEELDSDAVYTLGYAAGAETALRVAAAHARVAGVAVVAPEAAGLPSLLKAARGKDVLVVAPRWGTRADPAALRAVVAATTDGPARLDLAEPPDFRFGAPARAAVLSWLLRASARRHARRTAAA
jgi:dienelactone hydrolase